MRRNFYLGFAIVLVLIGLLLSILHSFITFLCILVVLALIWLYDVTQKKHAILRNVSAQACFRSGTAYYRWRPTM